MPRKALLIGAETNGLTGVTNDIVTMSNAISKRGFTIRECIGENATRAGILDAYDDLIEGAGADDTVFVYYSGHGGLLRPPPTADGSGTTMPMQFIVPADFDESAEDDFRGVTAVELSVRLARLTEKTRNVVVVLDCCHSASMSRDPDLLVKALPRPTYGTYKATYKALTDHVTKQRAVGLRTEIIDVRGAQDAVRIVACAAEQSAYEYTNDDGVRTGMLTEAMVRALNEAEGLPVTWSTLVERIRRRVLLLAPNQRPEAEGPARRLLFEVTEADQVASLPVLSTGSGRVTLPGAPLLGVRVDDEFMVMPASADRAEESGAIGVVTVEAAGGLLARGRIAFRPSWTKLPLGARAYQTKAGAPAMPVRLPSGERAAVVRAAIDASPLLRPVGEGETCPVEVRIDDAGQVVVRDRIGPLHDPRPVEGKAVHRVVADLERLARATALRTMGEDPRFRCDEEVTVDWGRVVDGKPVSLEASGSVLYDGDLVYVRVRNDGARTVYVSLVDIGVSARIAVLTRHSPSGERLDPGEEYILGFDKLDGRLVGTEVSWPAGLDPEEARPETIVAIITSAPQDVSVLEQGRVRGVPTWEHVPTPLERTFAQMAAGGTREMAPGGEPGVRYSIRTIEFDLVAAAPPVAEEHGFLVDERPPPSMRLLTPRGGPPRRVAVRLDELVVHRNRALSSADIRLDAVVLTGGAATDQPVFRASTERFSNIRDGDRLPADKLLVYHGPAVDYLDIAIWVSRDTTGSLALSDLLREQLTSQELQTAGSNLAGMMVAAPQAAAAVAALGAGAVIVNVAYRLLLGVVGGTIGLYRTSLLAQEGFGVGRHPAVGLRTAQDFSFAYRVEVADAPSKED